jgi:hemolysin activation/secretion protein
MSDIAHNAKHNLTMYSTRSFHSPRTRLRAVAAAAAVVAFPLATLAQQAPDAGRLLEQTRPAQPAPQPARPVISAPAAAPALPSDATPVAVSRFQFEGNQAISSEKLAELLLDQRGAAVPFGQLRNALSRINAAYAAQGYFLARAVIPRQDLAGSQGVLRIQILEGRLGTVASNLNAQQQQMADATLAAQGVREGIALRQEPLERSLLLISERLGGEASASLAPGSAQGSTDVNLQAPAAPKRFNAQISLDNSGNRYSGQVRVLADLSLRDAGTLGDQVLLRSQLAQGLRYASLGYQLPVGNDGLRLDAAFSRLSYELCCQFAPLQAEGSVNQWSLGARYPLILSSARSLNVEANYTRRHSIDQTVGTTNADKTATPLTLALAWNDSSAFAGRMLQNGRLAFTSGKLDQKVALNPNTPSSYRKLKADYSALGFVQTNQQWLFKASGQAGLTNLDSSEKFSLGGASGVRGWPAGEATGDSGMLLTAEWRYQFMSSSRNTDAGQSTNSPQNSGVWTFSAFADAGQITQHKNLWATALVAGQPNSYSLSSIGVGLSYTSNQRWNISTQIARGLGNNPGRSAAGLNSDGRSRNTQVWVNAGVAF